MRCMMGIAIIGILGSLSGCASYMEMPSPGTSAVVWRGFDHLWTHNHRWNRFGNWVDTADEDCYPPGTCFQVHHAAASGTSPDKAAFTSSYTTVSAHRVNFLSTVGSIRLSANFGESLYIGLKEHRIYLDDVPVDLQYGLRDRDQYVVLLNGFDLASDGPADKPISFWLEVDNASYDSRNDVLVLTFRAFLDMGCSSEECWLTARDNDRFDYNLRVHMLIAAGDEEELIATYPDRITRDYEWDAPVNILPASPFNFPVVLGHGTNPDAEELFLPPLTGEIVGAENEDDILVGFRRLSLGLSPFPGTPGAPMDQHMLQWQSVIHAEPAENGRVPYALDLMFKNWTNGMQDFQMTAYPEIGAAKMSADLVMLQFPYGANIEHDSWTATHRWNGGDASATGEDAVKTSDIIYSD